MKTYNLCILGLGNVGRALVLLLQNKATELRERYGIEWRLTGVASRRLGWQANPQGLDASSLLSGNMSQETVAGLTNVREWLTAAQVDVLFEVTSLNPQSGQPAIEHIRAALELDAHAVTANKGTVVHAYHELNSLAESRGKRFMFDATVVAGAPIFSLFQDTLPAVNILRFRGLLNSTTGVIIAAMEEGQSFDEAVKKAQAMGIAETDPSADVDGWDATVKTCAIATVLMGVPVKLDDIQREGIRGLSAEMVQTARAAGTPYKLVARIERTSDGVTASVRPEKLAYNDPLSSAYGGTLLTHFEMDVLPELTITLPVSDIGKVGPAVTAYELMADFIRAVRA